MSTICTPIDWEPTADHLYQLALAVGGKPMQVDGPDVDGLYTITVRGVGEENLSAIVGAFEPDPGVEAPNPPRETPPPVRVTAEDGTEFLIDPSVLLEAP